MDSKLGSVVAEKSVVSEITHKGSAKARMARYPTARLTGPGGESIWREGTRSHSGSLSALQTVTGLPADGSRLSRDGPYLTGDPAQEI